MAKPFKTALKPRIIAVLAIAVVLAACGSQGKFTLPRTSASFNDEGVTKTGATAADGKPYTSFSSPVEVLQVKESVPDTDDNRKFGSQIEKATVIYKTPVAASTNPLVPSTNTVEVHVKWQGIANPLSFQGTLSTSGKNFVAQMADVTNRRPDLTMTASCTDAACYHGQFKISDAQNHSVGIIINKENRTLRLKVPADPQAAGYAPNPFADQFKAGKPVTVTTTEIYPGKSYYEIEEVTANKETPGLKLSGDLEEPGGDAIPVQMGDAAKDKGKASLIGNDEEGDLLFKFTAIDDSTATSTDDTPPAPETTDVPVLPNQPSAVQPQKNKPAPVQPASAKTEPAKQNQNSRPTTPAPVKQNQPSQPRPQQPQQQSAPVPVRKHRAPAVYLELTAPENDTTPAQNQPRGPAPTTNTGNDTPSPYRMNTCPIQASHEASAMIVQIMKDCGNSEVERYIHGSWASSQRAAHRGDPQPRLSQMQHFLYYNELREKKATSADDRDKHAGDTMTRVGQLKTVISILDAEQFPEIWSLVTLQETGFNNMAVGADGELGLWQFMADTAKTFGLAHYPQVSRENDQRRNVTLETKAAVRYYRELLDGWNGDIKFALASYNRGAPGMHATAKNFEKQVNQGKIAVPEFAEAYAISHDFWYVYRNRMIVQRRGHWDYVPSVLAAMFTAVAPQQYGIDSVQAMGLR